MLNLILSPICAPNTSLSIYEPLNVTYSKQGDLVINGILFEFSKMEPGATLPADSVDSPYVISEISKAPDGTLSVTLLFPHGYDAPLEAKFPEPILVIEDGPVTLPDACWPPKEEPQPEPEDDSEER